MQDSMSDFVRIRYNILKIMGNISEILIQYTSNRELITEEKTITERA